MHKTPIIRFPHTRHQIYSAASPGRHLETPAHTRHQTCSAGGGDSGGGGGAHATPARCPSSTRISFHTSALSCLLKNSAPLPIYTTTYRLPVGLPLLRKRPIKNIVQVHYPRVLPGAHPLTKKPEDSGYEIGDLAILVQGS